jgi:phage baseplate assembly protein V
MRGMSTSSLYPRIFNLMRFGTIEALDLVKAHCRVRTGALLTDWIAWCTPFAGAARTWHAPTIGEQVLLLCPEGELSAGVALRGLYTQTYPAPSTDPELHTVVYPDGACLSYHFGTGTLSATGLQRACIEASQIILRGHVIIEGSLTLEGSLTQSGGDLSSNGIVLHSHNHGGVTWGHDVTGGPQ